MAIRSVPVTLISGFKGSGKTALVEHLRRALRSRRPYFTTFEGEPDFLERLGAAIEMDGADSIIVEAGPSQEPFDVSGLLVEGEHGRIPPRGLRLDTLVTVVDASTALTQLTTDSELAEILDGCDPEDERAVTEVIVEQIEYADVIVVNKMDLVDESTLLRIEALITRLNPRARLIRSVNGRVRSEDVIGTGLFDVDETDEGAGWLAELDGVFEDWGAIEGVTSFTYIERRPFHPQRFDELLADFREKGLVRAKGTIWLASRHHEIGVWSFAGQSSLLSYGGAWFAATPAREWPKDERERADIMSEWVPPFGDRRQEIAFIGVDLGEALIRERLDECLLTSEEMKDAPDSWLALSDPLPDWHMEADEEGW